MDNKDKYGDDVRMILGENNQEIISGIFKSIEKYLEKAIKKYNDSVRQKIKENDLEGIIFLTAALRTTEVIKEDLNIFFNEAKNVFEVENEPG